MRALASFALCLVCVAIRANGSDAPPADPRLGAPFAKRERAVLGAETASVVVIEFSSFRCTHCRAFHEEVFPQLRERYVDTGKVQWVIINASNEAADRSSPVFLVARGALQQGRYWEMVDSLYQVGLHPPGFLAELITNSPRTGGRRSLEESLRDPSVREAVAADFSEYAMLGVRGTPTFLLRRLGRDGRWTRAILEDFQPLDYFQRVLDGLLKGP
jgi:protein-disulfide isomerase